MAIDVSVVLVGATSPRHVQIEVTDLPGSAVVSVVGQVGAQQWQVRGADALVATSSQLLVTDVLAPLNVPITYVVDVNGTVFESSPITVPHATDYALTTIDGALAVAIDWLDNALPTQLELNQYFTRVPGRRSTVMRWARGGNKSGSWDLETSSRAVTVQLEDMLAEGAPLVMRTSGSVRDLPPSMVVALTDPKHQLVGAVGELRAWEVNWLEVADPLALEAASSWTIGDLSTVMDNLGGLIYYFNAVFTGLGGTMADINRHDWASEAAP